ncbi:654_t:CDS:1, partial [Entrophospora sp. SA101]
TTFNVHGGTDVMIVNDYDIANHLIPEEIYVVLELKKMGRKHIMQVILKMFIADLITSDNRNIFGVLSDLKDDWHIY